LQNGELSNATSTQQPSVYWVLIGTNDLGSGCTPEVVLVGILRVVEELLLQQPTSTIVINGILPRSSPLQHGYLIYNHSYWKAIEAINDALEQYSQHRSNRVHYFDARDIFLVNATVQDESQLQIQVDWMPDLLHPSRSGYQRWGEAIVSKLKTIIR
jgi:lysophospholipase L1-like esterase